MVFLQSSFIDMLLHLDFNGMLTAFFKFILGIVNYVFPDKNPAYGITIIVFTIIVRLILLPLSIKQTRSMIKMNELQPEMKKLQQKYKSNPQKMNEETMKLYKEKGANPMGGCLPTLIQLPILWALFYVFTSLKGLNGVGFLWIKNLAKPDTLIFGVIRILPILTGITQYIMILTNSTPVQDEAQAKQTSMMNIGMSIFMVFIAWNFSSALVLYYVVFNLIQIGQNVVILRIEKSKAAKVED